MNINLFGRTSLPARPSAAVRKQLSQQLHQPKFGYDDYREISTTKADYDDTGTTIYERGGQRYMEITDYQGLGKCTSTVKVDDDGRPVNDEGWPMEYVNGSWRDVDICR